MRQLAVEWAPHQITVNAIAPGYFPTEMTVDPALGTMDTTMEATIRTHTPMGRTGEVRETTMNATPTSASELHPNRTRPVCVGRTRPNESHAYGRNSGQWSLIEAIRPATVPARSLLPSRSSRSQSSRWRRRCPRCLTTASLCC